ncbi:MAG: hypothetical protein HYY00_09255 [Chloroflexi bacterium]|nr:hypothetical protein [Chloroflexota bacterium]
MAKRENTASPFGAEVRLLLQAAMVIFLVTVIVGILNGLDVIDFDRKTLLAHVHAGTLGWITLGFFAACLWLFSERQPLSGWRARSPRPLSWAATVAIAFYVVAFYSGNLTARLIGGSVTLIAIVWFFAWVVAQSRRVRLSTPHLGMLAAATTLTLGAVLGVVLGVWLKGGLRFLPAEILNSHPVPLIVGYLILAGMAVSEWRLNPASVHSPASRAGWAQVVLPFIGGLVVTVGAVLNNQALIGLYVPLEVTGVAIYVVRLRRHVVGAAWLAGNHERLFAISALFLVANVGLFTYLIVSLLGGAYGDPPDFVLMPAWLIFAMDHAMFIGVLSNVLFGLVYEATGARRSFWPWADHVLFWGMNVGVVGFVVGLIMQEAIIKQIFTPIMGTSILLGMATYTVRLRTGASENIPVQAG